MGLFDRILIKDNHLAAKKIKNSTAFTKMLTNIKGNQQQVILEVEIDSIDFLIPAIKGGVDAVLLDNFSPEKVREAVNINQERVVLEASGGIKKGSLEKYAQTRPHFISTGSPIHASRWVDIGLDWL